MVVRFAFVALVVLAFMPACGPKDTEYKRRILETERTVTDLTSFYSVFSSQPFVEVFVDPGRWLDSAMFAIRSNEYGVQQKMIVVLSMQKLELARYLVFLEFVFEQWIAGRVSDDLLQVAFVPGSSWNTAVTENYKNPQVRRIVGALETEPGVPEVLSGWAASALAGESLRDLQIERAAGLVYVLPSDFLDSD